MSKDNYDEERFLLGNLPKHPDNYDEDVELIIKQKVPNDGTYDESDRIEAKPAIKQNYNPDLSLLGELPTYSDIYDESNRIVIDGDTPSDFDPPKNVIPATDYDENHSLIPERFDINNFTPEGIYNRVVDELKDLGQRVLDSAKDFVYDYANFIDHKIDSEIEYQKARALSVVDSLKSKALEETIDFASNIFSSISPVEDINSLKSKIFAKPQNIKTPNGFTESNLDKISEIGSSAKPKDIPINSNYIGGQFKEYTISTTKYPNSVTKDWSDYNLNKYYKGGNGIISKNNIKKDDEYTLGKAQSTLNTAKQHFIFNITNLARTDGTNVEHFPAFITNLNESSDASWNSESIINRSEDIFIYQRGGSSFNIDFILTYVSDEDVKDTQDKYTLYTSNGSATLEVLTKTNYIRKLNFLKSLTRPMYVNDLYTKSPYAILNLGDLYVDKYCIIESVNYSFSELVWDFANSGENTDMVIPMIVQISLSGRFFHETPPGSDYIYYAARGI